MQQAVWTEKATADALERRVLEIDRPHGRTLPAALVARGREPHGTLPSAPSKPPTLSPAPGPQPRVRVGSMREARRAIALIAVLGPCRGLEPPSRAGRRGEQDA